MSYGIGRLGSSALLSVFSLATVYVYWGQFHLDPVLTGWANAIGKIVIAVAGFFMGYVSDATVTRWGRRKPFVAVGAPLLALSFFLYFTPQYFVAPGNESALFAYAALFNGLFHFAYALLLTPFQSWMAEITEPPERIGISRIQNISNIAANAVGVLLGFLMPALLSDPSDSRLPLLLVGLGIVEVALYLPSLAFVPVERKPAPKPDMVRELKTVLSNRNYMKWLLVQGLVSVATVMVTSVILSYVTTVLGITDVSGSIGFAVVLLVAMVAFFYVWGHLAAKHGKGKTLLLSNLVLVLVLPFTLVLGQVDLPIGVVGLGYAFIAVGAVGLSGFQLFPYAIVADLIHEDEIRTEENRAGMYTGFNHLPLNIFQTLSYVISGYLLSMPDMPDKGYTSGLVWWGPMCAVFVLMGSLVLARTNVDPRLPKGSSQAEDF